MSNFAASLLVWALALSTLGNAGCGATQTAADAAKGAVDSSLIGSEREDISFSSEVRLTGYLTTHAISPPGAPGVLLIHQYERNDEQWGQWPEALAAQGYRVLAFNLRGHGDSDAYGGGSLLGILSDPAAAPADVVAALAYLANEGQADPNRIAVIGTSIGANLTLVAAINDLAKTYVSLSSRLTAVETLASAEVAGLASVFYLASENDGGGVQAADAESMHALTTSPREIKIYASSSDHGVALLDNQSDAGELIETWLRETL